MSKAFKILICFVVVNFYFFSTTFFFTRGTNTKQIMAVVGIVLFAIDMFRRKEFVISREFVGLLIYSGLISLTAFFTYVYHNTHDRTYADYFMSMLTWLSASYVAVRCVKAVHGKLSIELLSAYIISITVAQGLIAVLADLYAPLGEFIIRVIPNLRWCTRINRLYGFGDMATLDTGGIRFALASVLCANNIKISIEKEKTKVIPLYILAFLLITVTGNMVARTTIVGSLVGLGYFLLYTTPFSGSLSSAVLRTWLWVIMETIAVFLIVSVLYNTDEQFYRRTRFAFEGFFSLVEEGHWRTASNDVLVSMYVFPDNAETWLIGDGYFISPNRDENYLGELMEGYYMDTDVGYLRFIFYFGLLGLTIFSLYIIYAGRTCAKLNPGNDLFFIVLTSMHFLIWLKVATDCFFVLCLFICLGYVRNNILDPIEE